MKTSITVSAPGKLMLLGEHAVVHGSPCIVTAVGQRMFAIVELTDDDNLHIDASDVQVVEYIKPLSKLGNGEIPKGARFIEVAVKNFIEYIKRSRNEFGMTTNSVGMTELQGVKITTKSEFSSQFGFGSSSASTVCTIKALSEIYEKNLSQKEIFNLSYKTVLDIQGTGSGFDVASAVYGGTLYYVIGGKVLEPLKVESIPLIIGYSGVKGDTVPLINHVTTLIKTYPDITGIMVKQVEKLVNVSKEALLKEDWRKFGECMNINQGFLDAWGVNTGKLSAMIYAARENGAYGSKLSGSGGGDCMIAISSAEKMNDIKKEIENAGGKVINIPSNVEGVRIEKVI